jgi:hypothetical protein
MIQKNAQRFSEKIMLNQEPNARSHRALAACGLELAALLC